MSKTTIKRETQKILQFAQIRHSTKPIAMLFSDIVDTDYTFRWNGEVTLAHFFDNIPEKKKKLILCISQV